MATARELITYLLVKTNDEELKRTNQNIDNTIKKANDFEKTSETISKQQQQRAEEAARRQKELEDNRYKNLRNNLLATTSLFTLAQRTSINFQRALMDIKKVSPHIELQEAEQTIMRMSKYAAGKSLTDLAIAYKTFAQTIRDQADIEGMMKLTEKGSIAYDMSAPQTATALSIIRNNFDYNNEDVARLGDKIAYSHHQYGNAQVPEIMNALQLSSGIAKSAGLDEDFLTTYATVLLNAGFQSSEVQNSLKRLTQRTFMGEFWENRTSFQEAGRQAGIDMIAFANEMVKAKKTNSTGEVMMKLFKKLEQADKEGKNTSALWSLLGGINFSPHFQTFVAQLQSANNLLNVLSNKRVNVDGTTIYTGEQERAYQTMMQTTSKQIALLGNALETLAKVLTEGNLPALNSGIQALTKGINVIVDNNFGATIGKSLMAYMALTGGVFLKGFIQRHIAGITAALLPVNKLVVALTVLTPVVMDIAEWLGAKLAEDTPEEKMKKIETRMAINGVFNKMTPVDLNHLTLGDVAHGRKTAEMSVAAGLFTDRFKEMRGGYYIDAGDRSIKTGGMTLVQNVNINAEYSQLQSQVDLEKANNDLVKKVAAEIAEKSRDSITAIEDGLDNMELYLANSK